MLVDYQAPIDTIEALVDFESAVRDKFSDTRNIWFRGLKDRNYHLIPSVFRRYNPERGTPCVYEAELTSAFMARARSRYPKKRFAQMLGVFDWLTFMRHYELPTRLLDWSESIGVAAFFATAPPAPPQGGTHASADSVIWALRPYSLWRTRNAALHRIPNARDTRNPAPSFESLFNAANHALSGIVLSPQSERRTQLRIPIPIVPDETNHRMLVQRAAFTLHVSNEPLEGFGEVRDHIYKAVIPGPARARIHDGLKALGFDYAGLFPDVDNLARGLAERYAIPETDEHVGQ